MNGYEQYEWCTWLCCMGLCIVVLAIECSQRFGLWCGVAVVALSLRPAYMAGRITSRAFESRDEP